MAKFNEKSVGTKTTNYMGSKAYKNPEKLDLVLSLLTSFAENSYYEKAEKSFDKVMELIMKNDPLFSAKAAIYARRKFGMRSMTHLAAYYLAKHISGKEWAKSFFNHIIYRPDDMIEIISLFMKNKDKIPNALKKGFSEAFGKFDAYQLAKYRAEGKAVKLVDVVNIVHPVPIQKNSDALGKLIKGTLKSVDTWEAKVSQSGKETDKKAAKKEAWKDLVLSKKIGYFALLKNLRNIIQEAPEVIPQVCDTLTNIKLIKKSLVLPFRYLSAYQEVEKITSSPSTISFEKDGKNKHDVLKAIVKAIELSIDNIPVMDGKTVILSDNSGSMGGDFYSTSVVSAMSKVSTANIANLFATMYWTKANDTFVGLFGDRLVHPKLNRGGSLMDNYKTIINNASLCGGATETGIYDFFYEAIEKKVVFDTLVVFSDCQIGSGNNWYTTRNYKRGYKGGGDFNALFQKYKRKVNNKAIVFSVNLKNYGNNVFSEDVFKLGGWSEKIFEIMQMMGQDKNALIRDIEAIEL